ncbi:MAG: hypothetical protein AAF826_10285 [Pseudomonadota bacterium]
MRSILSGLFLLFAAPALSENIIATEIAALSAEGVGLLAPSQLNLPNDLFVGVSAEAAARAFPRHNPNAPPAVNDLLRFVAKTSFDPPVSPISPSPFLLKRLDHLEKVGSIDALEALLRQVGTNSPQLFERWMAASIWLGLEVEPCEVIDQVPSPKPLEAVIFCTALNGDPNRAIAMVEIAASLGRLNERDTNLFLTFFDPEIFEDLNPGAAKPKDSAIAFFMRFDMGFDLPKLAETLGPELKTLNGFAPWRDRINAAEALARSGAITGARMLAVYQEGSPPASGQPWDRIEDLVTAWDRQDVTEDQLKALLAQFEAAGLLSSLAEAIAPLIDAELAETSLGKCFLTLSATEDAPQLALLDTEPPSPLRFVLRDSDQPVDDPDGRDLLEALTHLSADQPDLRQMANDLGVLRAIGLSDWADLIAMQIYAKNTWCAL